MSIDLKRFRADNKLSQIELANILGIGQSFVSQIENGRNPMPDGIKDKLSEIYGCLRQYETSYEETAIQMAPDETNQQDEDMTYNRFFEAIERRDRQIDEILSQNSSLLRILERMQGASVPEGRISPPLQIRDQTR